jgi:pimeloyl-ACP methyl ester carboxylesterase
MSPRLPLTLIATLLLAAPANAALHVDCRGARTAAPTVILESGAFGTSADWDFVLDDLAAGGRVCAYDRAGVGESPPDGGAKDVVSIARELAGVLDALGETKPVILVGHSNGALYAEAFAAMWPGRAAGLVYVNGVTSNDMADPRLVDDLTRERHLANAAALAGSLGLAPLAAPAVVRKEALAPDAARRKLAALEDPARLRAARDEDRAIVPALAVVAGLGGSPPQIPTVAIISEDHPQSELGQAWREAEMIPALKARQGWVLEAVGATHVSPLTRDRAWVTAAVDWLRSAR